MWETSSKICFYPEIEAKFIQSERKEREKLEREEFNSEKGFFITYMFVKRPIQGCKTFFSRRGARIHFPYIGEQTIYYYPIFLKLDIHVSRVVMSSEIKESLFILLLLSSV